jgi:hypothetical protein
VAKTIDNGRNVSHKVLGSKEKTLEICLFKKASDVEEEEGST